MRKAYRLCGMFASAFLLISGTAMAAGNQPCYLTYYQTKSADCLDTLEQTLRNLKPNATNPTDHSNFQGIVGLLSVIFASSPQERGDLLGKEGGDFEKGLYVESLYRAGLPDDAKAYADANGQSDLYNRYQNQNLATLKTVIPGFIPADNDLLIGAYMASGDVEYINRLLGSFTSVDDATANDAFRMALMQSKFGATLTPPGREKAMALALCAKYECKANLKQFLHVGTLAAAIWALQSLSQQDEGIKKTLGDFFDNDPRLKKLLFVEESAFSNYLTLLVAYGAIKDNPNLNAALLAYENLGSAQDVIDAMHPKK
jgi:hypothetical protein